MRKPTNAFVLACALQVCTTDCRPADASGCKALDNEVKRNGN